MRFQELVAALVFVAGCGGASVTEADAGGQDAGESDAGTHDAGTSDAGSHDAGTADAGTSDAGAADAGSTDAGTSDAGTPDGGAKTAVLRVHYPVASGHALTLRGAVLPLRWTAGSAMTNQGGDVWSYTVEGLSAATELKPLLDDAIWALGPNYHLAPGQTVDLYPHFSSRAGRVITLFASFKSTVLNNTRDVYAYLPASYAENSDATYPVVYLHDGQNLWAALPQLAFSSTWNVDTAFDDAASEGACSSGGQVGWAAPAPGAAPATCTGDGDCASGSCRTFPEAIVVAPGNTSGRIYEYTPTPDPTTPGGGGGDLYLQFLINELKPAVEAHFGARARTGVENTVLAGSSLGGLISAYAGYKRPDVYGAIGAISPSSWWNNGVIIGDIKLTKPSPLRPLRVYVDSGSGDADDQSDTDLLSAAYLSVGYQQGANYTRVLQTGATHGETYWAERFPGAMQFLLGER